MTCGAQTEEWSRVVAALRDVQAGRGAVFVVEGETGIGRSRLLAETVDVARKQGITAYAAAADELTQWTPLAPIAASLGETVWTSADVPMVLAGRLLRRIETEAARGPVLLALDDLQWADSMTLAALQSFVADLRSSPVVWLLACRDGVGEATVVGRLFDRLVEAGAVRLRLAPLSSDVVRKIVEEAFDAAPADDLIDLVAGAQGNPALVTRLVEGLRAENLVRVRENSASLASSQLPRRFKSAVRRGVDGFGADAVDALEVAAVLGRSFRVADVAEVLGRSSAEVLRAVREVLRAGLLDRDEHDDTLSFRHHLVWRVVTGTIVASVASALHRQVGLMLLGRNGSDPTAVEHLLLGALPGDAPAVRALGAAAEEALASAPSTAVDIAVKALGLTKPGTPEYFALNLTRITALQGQGKLAEAAALIHTSFATSPPPPQTARLRTSLAVVRLLEGRYEEALSAAEEVIAGGVDAMHAETRALAESSRLVALWGLGDRLTRQVVEATIGSRPVGGDDDVVLATAKVVLSLVRWADGDIEDALELARQAARCPAAVRLGMPAPHPHLVLLALLVKSGDCERARRVLAEWGADIERAGYAVGLRTVEAWLMAKAGLLADAAAAARAVDDSAEVVGVTRLFPSASDVLGEVAFHRGDLAEARRRVDNTAPARTTLVHANKAWLDLRVASAELEPARVVEMLRTTYASLVGHRSPLLLEPAAAGWLVRIALAAGDRDLAGVGVDVSADLAGRNPGSPALAAAADHARGLFDWDPAILREAVRKSSDPFARGTASEDLALVLADVGPSGEQTAAEVVPVLDAALRDFEAAGSTRDAARIRSRLRALGVRRRHWNYADRPATGWDSLTDTERAVVELVVEGLTNRQVAARMFVSRHTVHAHLGRVFRKLGVSSRVELTGLRHRIA